MATKKNIETTTKKATKKATTKKQAKPEVKKAAPAPKAEKVEKTDLDIHVNKTGRVCFGRIAAGRIGDLNHMAVKVEGKTITLIPRKDATEESTEIRRAGKRPYISATKALKETGAWDGTAALDIVAEPLNGHGFRLKVA